MYNHTQKGCTNYPACKQILNISFFPILKFISSVYKSLFINISSSSNKTLLVFINRFEVITFGRFFSSITTKIDFRFKITISGLLSNGGRMCRRIADIRQINWMLRNALGRVSSVGRGASSERLRSSGRSAGKDQRMIDGRFRVPAFDLVLSFLQHCRLERNKLRNVFKNEDFFLLVEVS